MKNRCNNCVKILTCNRTECNQVTYLQANQIDRIAVRKVVKPSIEEEHRRLIEAMIKIGVTSKQILGNLNTKK